MFSTILLCFLHLASGLCVPGAFPGSTEDVETKSRQAERSEATRSALLRAGRELFTEKGFADTATEEVVARAGVTRGALYHHFRDKTDLFRAVHEELENELIERVAAAMGSDDVLEAVVASTTAYLEACRDPAYQRITHTDGPGVLGWEEWWKTGDEHGLGLIREGLQRVIDAGLMDPKPVELFAHMVRGALMEAGQFVSRVPEADIEEVERTVLEFLMGLLREPPQQSF